MAFSCPACSGGVEETANYCAHCGASLIAPGLERSEVPEPEPEPGFRVSKSSRPGSWFSWSFDISFTGGRNV